MNASYRPMPRRGAAIILALIFISGIAILTISALTMARNDVANAAEEVQAQRAEIGSGAALAEAKVLLLNAVAGDETGGSFAGDDYLVSTVIEGDEAVEEGFTRYTYIIRPERSGSGSQFEAIPLFAGGEMEGALTLSSTDLHEADPILPEVRFEPGLETATAIDLPPLTHQAPGGGALIRENPRPETRWKVLPSPSEGRSYQVRYTYWIEDLQGYPNLDYLGQPGAEEEEDGEFFIRQDNRTYGLRWGGYANYDSRTLKDGVVFPFDGATGTRYSLDTDSYVVTMPASIRSENHTGQSVAQLLTGQAAPGLSPREIPFYPWPIDGVELFDHPYWRTSTIRSHRDLIVSTGSIGMLAPFHHTSTGRENFAFEPEVRYAQGLQPYREVPLIPRGFGYADEGKPRYNLNAAVAMAAEGESGAESAVEEIAEVIEKNLGQFAGRKGAFPEDYVRTIAAGMIDYADADSNPTIREPELRKLPYNPKNDADAYRGMEHVSVVNEFFFKFTYDGWEDIGGGKAELYFLGVPYVELWNPTQRSIDISEVELELDFYFLEPFMVTDGNGQKHPIENRNPDGPVEKGSGQTFLHPNEYVILTFGEYEWTAEIPFDSAVDAFPIVEGFEGEDRKETEANYDLIWDGKVVDRAGRIGYHHTKGSPDVEEPVHGVLIPHLTKPGHSKDFSGSTGSNLVTGDYAMRSSAPGLITDTGTEGTNLGDSRMSYYMRTQHAGLQYVEQATPWGRNARVEFVGEERYTDEARVWDWPDRGYASQLFRPSLTGPLSPDLIAKPADFEPHLAPWRISNEGRFYSVSELGNIYDPMIWRAPMPSNTVKWLSWKASGSKGTPQSRFEAKRDMVFDIKETSLLHKKPWVADRIGQDYVQQWGGGNTLRIGRKEHPLFDKPGMRASQLLDLFHVGAPGANCPFGSLDEDTLEFTKDEGPDAYANYHPGVHQPPPSGMDADEAKKKPFSTVYPSDVYASGPYRWIHGQLNLNTVPTSLEIEAILRGAFASANVTWDGDPTDPGGSPNPQKSLFEPKNFRSREGDAVFENGLNTDPASVDGFGMPRKTVTEVAQELMRRRPFLSPSHLASAVAEAIAETDEKASALPDHYIDAVAEEPFARLFNTTTLTSRHFRIYTEAEVISEPVTVGDIEVQSAGVVGRSSKYYDVFLRPIRDSSGKIISTQFQILQAGSL